MKLLLQPAFVPKKDIGVYEFEEDKIAFTLHGVTDVFDFREFPDGILELRDEHGNYIIETDLDEIPIIRAKRVDGVLYVELFEYLLKREENFAESPDWIDHENYAAPEPEEDGGEADGSDEMEE